MKKTIIILCTAAILLTASACSKVENDAQTHEPTMQQTPTATIMPEEAVEETVIVSSYEIEPVELNGSPLDCCEDGSISDYLPMSGDGTPIYSDALKAALDDPALEDALFDVWIRIKYNLTEISGLNRQSFVYENMTIDEWHELYLTTLRAREAHKMQLHSELENVPYFDKWSGGSEEAIALEAQWDADWQVAWEQEHPDALYPLIAYNDAKKALGAALEAADAAFINAELARLEEMGIIMTVVPNENLYAAVLTREQALALPVSDDIIGYTMIFAHEEDYTVGGVGAPVD